MSVNKENGSPQAPVIKWYERATEAPGVIVSSRVRLARNLAGRLFPERLEASGRQALRAQLRDRLEPLLPEPAYHYQETDILPETERRALRERRLINSILASSDAPMGIFISADDEKSVLLCGDDHLRLQNTCPGMSLQAAWEELSDLDDRIGEVCEYAFDEKYGYLTAFPTNVGTGLRATALLHLPALSQDKTFRKLISEMNRFGLLVRPVYGDGGENYGSLYEISNVKTLGLSEGEILATVQRMAGQMASQEEKLRRRLKTEQGASREDTAYKAYGVLRYARTLTVREAMEYLSCLRAAQADGLVKLAGPVSLYGLMLKVQDDMLPGSTDGSRGRLRAALVRGALPELA